MGKQARLPPKHSRRGAYLHELLVPEAPDESHDEERLAGGDVGVQGVVLGAVAHHGARQGQGLVQDDAVDQDLAAGGAQVARQAAEGGRLARAVETQEAEALEGAGKERL